jgi:hypothetical protein
MLTGRRLNQLELNYRTRQAAVPISPESEDRVETLSLLKGRQDGLCTVFFQCSREKRTLASLSASSRCLLIGMSFLKGESIADKRYISLFARHECEKDHSSFRIRSCSDLRHPLHFTSRKFISNSLKNFSEFIVQE